MPEPGPASPAGPGSGVGRPGPQGQAEILARHDQYAVE
jgi:hypothetical protein